MDEEKWFTAEKAVQYGFADTVKESEKKSGSDQQDTIAAMVATAIAAAMNNYQQPAIAASAV